jgi:hypothetical protein
MLATYTGNERGAPRHESSRESWRAVDQRRWRCMAERGAAGSTKEDS